MEEGVAIGEGAQSSYQSTHMHTQSLCDALAMRHTHSVSSESCGAKLLGFDVRD